MCDGGTTWDQAAPNNSLSLGGLRVLAKKFAARRSFNSTSVFLDIGCGVGMPCIYFALRYGVKCIGVERHVELVDRARRYARVAGVEKLCTFLLRDAATPRFYSDHSHFTHLLAFDACFGDEALPELYWNLSSARSLIGCSTCKTSFYWKGPKGYMKKLGPSTQPLKMMGLGASSFCFGFWTHS